MTTPSLRLNVGTFNVRGLKKRMECVEQLANTTDIIGLCETWARESDTSLLNLLDVQASTEPTHRCCRGFGGVGFIIDARLRYSILDRFTSKKYQTITIVVGDTACTVLYMSPLNTAVETKLILERIRTLYRGRHIIMGDLNARHTNWDTKTNARGRQVMYWANKHGWKLSAPKSPSYSTVNGDSTPDIILHKGVTVSGTKTWDQDCGGSDHKPVLATMEVEVPEQPKWRTVAKHKRQEANRVKKAQTLYRAELPKMMKSLKEVNHIAEMETWCAQLVHLLSQPWMEKARKCPDRFKAFWTWGLDRLARHRAKWYRKATITQSKTAWDMYHEIDRDIKHRVRTHKTRQMVALYDNMEQKKEVQESAIIARFLRTQGKGDSSNAAVRNLVPSLFTKACETGVNDGFIPPIEFFEVDDKFKNDILTAIQTAPRKKATGIDGIAIEAFQVDCQLTSELLAQIWHKCATLRYIPSMWSRAELVPVYKKGNTFDPMSYRPIALLSHGRKAIDAALALQIRREYNFHDSQLGFQRVTGTETAIIRHIQNAQRLRWTAILDLRQAYPSMPRERLTALVHQRLSRNVARMINGALQPLRIVTRGDKSATEGTVTKGVPQGSPLSPTLFNIVMDTLAEELEERFSGSVGNEGPRRGTWDITMFADDVKIQAVDYSTLQLLLKHVERWAQDNGMTWGVSKCAVLTETRPRPEPLLLAGSALEYRDEAEYLGVSATATGVSETKSINRLRGAKSKLNLLRNMGVHSGRIPSAQMLRICEALVLTGALYGLHLVPLSTEVMMAWKDLEDSFMKTCLGCAAPSRHARLRAITKFPSLEERMALSQTAAEQRLKQRAALYQNNRRAQIDAGRLKHVWTYVGRRRTLHWSDLREEWNAKEAKMARGTPPGTKMTHVPLLQLRNNSIRKYGIYWYCGTFPRGLPKIMEKYPDDTKEMTKVLKEMMVQRRWSTDEIAKVERALEWLTEKQETQYRA